MKSLPGLIAITPPEAGPWVHQLDTLWDSGVDGLIVRLLHTPAALPDVLRQCPPHWTVLVRPVAASDAMRALDLGRGLHLPSAIPPQSWRTHTHGLLSAACHSAEELARAEQAGVDLALLSPVFPPSSKPGDTRPTLGSRGFCALAQRTSLPTYALGGIHAGQVRGLHAAAGVASIGAFFRDGHVDPVHARALAADWKAACSS